MVIENNINNHTIISTSIVYSHPNTNIESYGSSSASSTVLDSSKTIVQNDITTTLLPSLSVSNEVSSSNDTPINLYTYISSNPISSFTSQQSDIVSNPNMISSTITGEKNSPTMLSIQSIHSNLSQQGYSSLATTSSKHSSRTSTSYSPLVSAITSKISPNLEASSSSLIPFISSSSLTSSIDSQDPSTRISNLTPMETAALSVMTYYDTTSKIQYQSSSSSLLEDSLWLTSEVSTTFKSKFSSTNIPTTSVTSLNNSLYTPSFTQNSLTNQYSFHYSPITQEIPTNKTLIRSSRSTTIPYSLSKTPILKSIKETSSSLSSSSISPSTSTNSKFTTTKSSSSLSSSSVSSSQNNLVYTQEYYFTGKTTSFSTGIPVTLTLSPSGTKPEYSLSTTAVITAPVDVYNKWINGGGLDSADAKENDNTNKNTGTNDGTIVGGVIGAVGGVILCVIIVWFVMFKRKRYYKSWNSKLSLGKSGKSGSMLDDPISSSQSFTHSKGYKTDYNSTKNIASDPFKHEFQFDNRYNTNITPPVPAPRKNKPSNNKEFNSMGTPASNLRLSHNSRDDYHLRFSYVSSDTDSSFNSSAVGSYSTISSSPNKYGTINNNKQGFLREML